MITQASIWAALSDAGTNGIFAFPVNAGAPTSGSSGTGAGLCGPGSLLIDTTNKVVYQNTNTKASPTWIAVTRVSSVQALAALGTNQATAAAITLTGSGVVYVTAADATVGVKLPVGVVGMQINVANDAAANAVLKVYGNATDSATINGVAGSTAYAMAAKTSAVFTFVAAAKWQTTPLLAS